MSTASAKPAMSMDWTDTVDVVRSTFRTLNALATAVADEDDEAERGFAEDDLFGAIRSAYSKLAELNYEARRSEHGVVGERAEINDLLDRAWRDVRMALALSLALLSSYDGYRGDSELLLGDLNAFLAERNAHYRQLDRRA